MDEDELMAELASAVVRKAFDNELVIPPRRAVVAQVGTAKAAAYCEGVQDALQGKYLEADAAKLMKRFNE